MLSLRKLKNNDVNESYVFFCQNFLKCVVGTQSFNKGWRHGVPIMTIATASDEAMALLLLENSEARWWIAEHSKKNSGEKVIEKNLLAPLHTSAGQSNKKQQKGFTRQCGGWRQDLISLLRKGLHPV